MSFGHALYYPHINLTNQEWLKYALLYWDKISRIVPTDVEPKDSDDIKRLRSEADFIEDYAPQEGDVRDASDRFFHGLSFSLMMHGPMQRTYESRFGLQFEPLTPEMDRNLLERRYNYDFENGKYKRTKKRDRRKGKYYIHASKLDPSLKIFLLETKMAVQGENWYEDYISIDSEIGLLYMSYLARSISDKTGRPVVTDELGAFGASEAIYNTIVHDGRERLSHSLGGLLISTYGPMDMNALTFGQILKFRKKHDDDRRAFFEHVDKLCASLPEISSEEEFKDALDHYEPILRAEAEKQRRQLVGMRIEPVLRFVSISAPTSVGALTEWVPEGAAPIIILAGATLGVASALHEQGKAKKEASEHPLSYLLSLHSGLDANNMFSKLRHAFRSFF